MSRYNFSAIYRNSHIDCFKGVKFTRTAKSPKLSRRRLSFPHNTICHGPKTVSRYGKWKSKCNKQHVKSFDPQRLVPRFKAFNDWFPVPKQLRCTACDPELHAQPCNCLRSQAIAAPDKWEGLFLLWGSPLSHWQRVH